MADFSLLSINQIDNSLSSLRALKLYGRSALATDFVNLLGGYVTSKGAFYWLKDKKASSIPPNVYFVDDVGSSGMPKSAKSDVSSYCIRPTIMFDLIRYESIIISEDTDSMEIEYGEFPQTVEKRDVSSMLESLYQIGGMTRTKKVYTINDQNKNVGIDNKPFVPKPIAEYEFSNKKYVRVIADSKNLSTLDNGTSVSNGSVYWVKVEPVRWIVDKFSNVCVCKKAIMTGIPINHNINYFGYFEDSDLKKYLDFYLCDEIKRGEKKPIPKKTVSKKKTTPYGFNFSNVTEEEIIKGAVLSDVAVFLHGRSSDGKSARVKAIDPDCEIIYLRNATPELLNGKSVYNSMTGEMLDIPPTWYKRMLDKCEQYPNRIHILFLDEITNALHSIQGMAFNLVLNKEVNGIWKLPDNVRIVAAGNDLEDSLAANTLVEPLFNRFAHVYINTNAKSWLNWAIENKDGEYLDYIPTKKNPKIHPAVYAYISARGDQALRTTFTGEKPNADPRKWELASKILYQTGRPMMIRSLVGTDIAKDFIAFCKQNNVSINDVIEGRYNMEEILKYDLSRKYSIVVGLSLADELNLGIIRNFVKRLEPELLSVFDSLWLQNNPDSLDLLMTISSED